MPAGDLVWLGVDRPFVSLDQFVPRYGGDELNFGDFPSTTLPSVPAPATTATTCCSTPAPWTAPTRCGRFAGSITPPGTPDVRDPSAKAGVQVPGRRAEQVKYARQPRGKVVGPRGDLGGERVGLAHRTSRTSPSSARGPRRAASRRRRGPTDLRRALSGALGAVAEHACFGERSDLRRGDAELFREPRYRGRRDVMAGRGVPAARVDRAARSALRRRALLQQHAARGVEQHGERAVQRAWRGVRLTDLAGAERPASRSTSSTSSCSRSTVI